MSKNRIPFIILAAILFCIGGLPVACTSPKSDIENDGSLVRVTSGNKKFNYREESQETLEYHIVDVTRGDENTAAMGFSYFVGLVTDSVYREFLTLQRERRCPANFLNRYAKKYMLMVNDPKIRAIFDSFVPKQAMRIKLQGSNLSFSHGEIDGHRFDTMSINGITMFKVSQAEVIR